MKNNKRVIATFLISILILNYSAVPSICAKYPDYSSEFLGVDKYETFNRKIFNFNLKLNKYALRPIHTIWSSILPEYGMDRLYGISNNIEYPVRLLSSLVQRDFKTSKNETIRFITNTTIGIGGMFDPARHIFKLEQAKEDMEQAFAKCKIKSGPYFVAPVLSFTDVRGVFGKILDMALNPSCYIVSPLLALIKTCLMVNRTSYIQPLIKMISTYADPYDIAKKAFGINNYIKFSNFDRTDVTSSLHVNDELVHEDKKLPVKKINPVKPPEDDKLVKIEVSSELISPELLYGGTNIDKIIPKDFSAENFKLEADIKLYGYNPQNPIVDSMRTALFSLPGVDDSIWNELSVWNRSFAKRIKTDEVNITDGKPNYRFKYILQKGNSPLAIVYPSIGEGIDSSHSVLLGKIFYDAGYSVLIQGSNFHWEFIKSMPDNYYPGLPAQDAAALRDVTKKIVNHISKKHETDFSQTVFIGTSFGAITSLFLAAQEFENNTLGNTKYISICPPVDLIYAMKQVDKNSEDWNKSTEDFKQKVALTAAKVVKLYQSKKYIKEEINNLPFSEEEGKLITGFIMHQKLSDLIYTIENSQKNSYEKINNMGYQDYALNYLLANKKTCDDVAYESSLHSISNYLRMGYNYKIYHSLNDYLTNTNQLKRLKQYTGRNSVIFDNGAHLGFLYRQEFIEDLKETIALK